MGLAQAVQQAICLRSVAARARQTCQVQTDPGTVGGQRQGLSQQSGCSVRLASLVGRFGLFTQRFCAGWRDRCLNRRWCISHQALGLGKAVAAGQQLGQLPLRVRVAGLILEGQSQLLFGGGTVTLLQQYIGVGSAQRGIERLGRCAEGRTERRLRSVEVASFACLGASLEVLEESCAAAGFLPAAGLPRLR